MSNFLIIVVTSLAGFGIMWTFFKGKGFIDVEKKQQEAKELLLKAKNESKELLNETNDYVQKLKLSTEEDIKRRKERLLKKEEALSIKENNIEKKEDRAKEARLRLASTKEEIEGIKDSTKRLKIGLTDELCKKTGDTFDNLKDKILSRYKTELESDNLEKIKTIEENLKETSEKTARKILIGSIQKLCSPTSVETRSVQIRVPKDHIKGKIVGKNAENIKVFEDALDVSVVFNDLPNTISLSAFNLVTRRIAQKAMEKLVRTRGAINESIIKQNIKEAEREVSKELLTYGKRALDKLGLSDRNINPEFIEIIGRLQYRTSYGQNIMMHSLEVAWVAAMLGGEIGLDIEVCKVAGFLHDVGKAIDQDPSVQDAHDRLTKELMEKYGFSWEEVHAAWTHHDAEPQETPEALIIKAADAVSAGRPGARQESIYSYSERIEALEEIAKGQQGVNQVYIMAAGREVRAFIDNKKVKESDMMEMAHTVARQIEDGVVYPGKIKVNIVRRTEHTARTVKK